MCAQRSHRATFCVQFYQIIPYSINKLLLTTRAFCVAISRNAERLLILMPYGRAFQGAADGLFAWTVLLRLRGDDGQREVVSQGWLSLTVLTGVNVSPTKCL